MTDRELLEMAAKAAGINLEWHLGCPVEAFPVWSGNPCEPPESDYRNWNPLDDDGDALRLAVRLGITAHQYSTCVSAKRHMGDGINCEEDYGDDPCAATRRAITRAAAEIGRAMP